jgi:multiple sugar transport system ATP-binding protein
VHTNERVRVAADGSGLQPAQPVTFGVRPEHLELLDAARAASDDAREATLTRGVSLVEHLGEHSYVHLDQPGGDTLIAKVPGGAGVAIGDRATFRAPAAACHLFTEDGFTVPAPGAVAHYA